jgi:branched-chain amino acid aminotransferase
VKVFIDSRIVDGPEARVPVTDHGLLYGDGVFEGIRSFAGRIFRLDDHLARLATSARAIALEIPGGLEAVREIVIDTVRAFGRPEAYIRLLVTRGEGELGVDPSSCARPRVICIVDDVAIYPPELRRRGLALQTVSVRRPSPDALDPRVKSLNYLSSVMAKLEARRCGADEALILNAAGHVAEAAVANVFVVCGGELRTPPPTDGALEGITRATVLELARGLGLVAREVSLGRVDLFGADEAFLTGTGAGIVPARSLDGRSIGSRVPGPLTEKLQQSFADHVCCAGVPVEPLARSRSGRGRRDGPPPVASGCASGARSARS